MKTAAEPSSSPASEPPPGEASEPPRERQISHADGPISARGPTGTVGRYALFEQFASGGMATVHFGRLDGAGGFARVVAIKRLLPHLLENRDFTQMLLKEARLAARVRHPNVAATLDVVATKGDVLLVLDYVHGEALSTLCRTQAKQRGDFVPLPIAVGIMQDVLQGLTAIHEATDEKGHSLGLIHRDISPPNVLVGADGVARVLDFGIATALDHIEETAAGDRKGKRGYMSPEQLRGERLTQRSDVFSAGIVLWELLALRRLFPADHEPSRTEAVLSGDFPRVASLRPDLPPELDALVARAIASDPEDRFETIRELAEELEAATPRANTRRIGEWVLDLARDALNERTRMVARAENWQSGIEIPLSSGPFASEAPPRPAPDWDAPEQAEPIAPGAEPRESSLPPLPEAAAAAAAAAAAFATAGVLPVPLPRAQLPAASLNVAADDALPDFKKPRSAVSRWLWFVVLVGGAVAYFVVRGS